MGSSGTPPADDPAADVSIRAARGRDDADACVELQRVVWGLADLEITPAIQLLATTHAGGLLHVAETADGRVVGFAYAFPAIRGGALHLHSDMLAVRPEARGRDVGVRLKLAQRDAARARGVGFIAWTFDPLQSVNARLNLRRLGARGVEFHENVYGVTTSALHGGLPTHRLSVRWDVDDALPAGRPETPPDGAVSLTRVKRSGPAPTCSRPELDADAPLLLLEIPGDMRGLVRDHPAAARDWHTHVCAALAHYLPAGWVASDLVPLDREGRPCPQLLLEKRSGQPAGTTGSTT